MSALQCDVSLVLQKLIEEQLIGPDSAPTIGERNHDAPQLMAINYDLDAIDEAFHKLESSFPSYFQHRFAVKSCPLSFFLKKALHFGLGLECASLTEVQHALHLGCPGENIVFDSPCKTVYDIRFALQHDVLINADNFVELERISQAIMEMELIPEVTPLWAGGGSKGLPRIGLRINTLVGAGSVAMLSVSTTTSKFGIPLTAENRLKIISSFVKFPWLSALHAHVGSQGCDLSLLTQGAKTLVTLANEIDAAVQSNQVQVLNIGGGLSVNYANETVRPTYVDYASALRLKVPELFTGHRVVMTEFGRSLVAKTAWFCSVAEYVKNARSDLPTAIIHAGSDLFVRPCYRPDLFHHEIEVYSKEGKSTTTDRDMKIQNISGPLCFGGDVLARKRNMPTMNQGDYVVIRDVGSNTMSLFSRHCSRLAPIIYGYRKEKRSDEVAGSTKYQIKLLKERETPEQVYNFWT
uniref:Diaminopimelate decarboxylase n=1 Tax=Skeletonema marinoi TaxID=267567 RepID=A0A7S2Q2D8_9STRA|mmetsp:Transcript_8285/g.14010  ORF Transcript_8285/g.14010 Transcript_8285/m.14010 type:complete len:465 (+) Transcript_8285:141-1535(+)